MDRYIKVIDNFIPKDFELIKSMVHQAHYGEYTFWEKPYYGFGQYTLPLKGLIEDVVGEPIQFVMSHLRLGNKNTPLTHYIHADNAAAKYACVVYFSEPPCETGTAFWKHRELGLDRLEYPCDPKVFELLDKCISDESKWDRLEYVAVKENRAVIFNSQLFHSRYPKDLPLDESDTPRLVCTIFFNKVSEVPSDVETIG